MVRNHEKPGTSRKILNESSASDESSDEQPKARSTRQSDRAQNNRRRKQNEPKRRGENPPVAALREIIRLQSTTANLIPKAPFGRLLKEIIQSFGDFRISKIAFDALQEAAETYLVALLEDSYKLTLHRNRVTLEPRDLRLVLYLRSSTDPGNK